METSTRWLMLFVCGSPVNAFSVLRTAYTTKTVGTLASIHAQVLSPNSLTFQAARGSQALDEAAEFFVDAFWSASTASAGVELTERGRAELVKKQRDDMEERYGELVGARRLKSELIVARKPGGAIAGCIGLEVSVLSVMDQTVCSRNRGENMFRQELDAMSGRERNQYRKMPLQELAVELLEPGYGVCPLLANLAVGADFRGSGLGRELCSRVEELALDWGYGGIVLQVEEGNAPAVGLYESLGYAEIFVNENWPALRPQPDGELTTERVNLVAYSKPVTA